MNSRLGDNDIHDNNSRCNETEHDIIPCHKDIKPSNLFIKRGIPGAITIGPATPAGTTFTLSSVTINSSSLCNPRIKLEFSSNIATLLFAGSLDFQIIKTCSNQLQPIPIGKIWSFSNALVETVGSDSNSFSFFVCDCDSCFNGCCTYTVVVTVGTLTIGTITISNALLEAIVADN